MNTAMYENPVTQENLNKLRKFGWEVVTPPPAGLPAETLDWAKCPNRNNCLN